MSKEKLNIPNALRLSVDKYMTEQEGETDFAFTAREMVDIFAQAEADRVMAANEGFVITQEQIEDAAADTYVKNQITIDGKMKAGFAGNIIKRHIFSRYNKVVGVSFTREDGEAIAKVYPLTEEEATVAQEKAKRNGRGSKKPETVDVEKLKAWQPDINDIEPEDVQAFKKFMGLYRGFVATLIGE